jgi:hypothetical protein
MSYQFLIKKGPTIAFLAALFFALVALFPIFGGLEAFDKVPTAQQSYSEEGNIFKVGIVVAGLLLIAAVGLAILLSVFKVATNPKGAMKALIYFGILVVLFLVLYGMAEAKGSGSLTETIEKFAVSDTISKVIGAGISLTLILGIGSIIIAVGMEIRNYFKNQ